jgi:hypothetical protein
MILKKQKTFTNYLVEGLVLLIIFITVMALSNSTIYCESNFEALVNFVEFIKSDDYLSTHFEVTLSNLELGQSVVQIPANGYDIEYNQPDVFFEKFYQYHELVVDQINGVYVNVFKINNVNYTVHPCHINHVLDLFERKLY